MKEIIMLLQQAKPCDPSVLFVNPSGGVVAAYSAGIGSIFAVSIENEIEGFTKQFCDVKDEQEHRIVTRNGYLPERDV